MTILQAGFTNAAANAGSQLTSSARFRANNSHRLTKTFSSAGSRTTWTASFWFRRSNTGGQQYLFFAGSLGTNDFRIYFTSPQNLYINAVNSGVIVLRENFDDPRVFRDMSDWNHLVFALDTTQATAEDRVRIYLNGIEFFGGSVITPAQNLELTLNNNVLHSIGAANAADPFDGYISEFYFVDGVALAPTDFGELDAATGAWNPKPFNGPFGQNGFHLTFDDPSSLAAFGADASGNGNDFTALQFNLTPGDVLYDAMTDTPNTVYPLLASQAYIAATPTFLQPINTGLSVNSTASTAGYVIATFPMQTSGTYYWEITVTQAQFTSDVVAAVFFTRSATYSGFARNGTVINDTGSGSGFTYGAGDVLGIAYDVSTGVMLGYKNGVLAGSLTTSLNKYLAFPYSITTRNVSQTITLHYNFGQQPWVYGPPSGFTGCAKSDMPEPPVLNADDHILETIVDGSVAVSTVTSTFPNALFFLKAVAGSQGQFVDTVRGTSVAVNTTVISAEAAYSAPTGSTIVFAWNLSQAAASNTDGSTTSTVSANQTAGVSVVTYSGTGANATVGHGLGVTPALIIVKRRNANGGWRVYTRYTGAGQYLELNTTATSAVSTTMWQNTAPTSSVFYLGNVAEVNAAGGTYVAFCFAEIPGFSQVSGYQGNGDVSSPMRATDVFSGFRAKISLLKTTTAGSTLNDWLIRGDAQNIRDVYRTANTVNLSSGVTTSGTLSHYGYTIRGGSAPVNTNGTFYLCASWGGFPYKYARAR